MSISATFLGVVYGKHAKNWKIMNETRNKAMNKWIKTRPKSGESLTPRKFKKFLTAKEYMRFKKAQKEFDAYWARERRKARLSKVM